MRVSERSFRIECAESRPPFQAHGRVGKRVRPARASAASTHTPTISTVPACSALSWSRHAEMFFSVGVVSGTKQPSCRLGNARRLLGIRTMYYLVHLSKGSAPAIDHKCKIECESLPGRALYFARVRGPFWRQTIAVLHSAALFVVRRVHYFYTLPGGLSARPAVSLVSPAKGTKKKEEENQPHGAFSPTSNKGNEQKEGSKERCPPLRNLPCPVFRGSPACDGRTSAL